MRQSGIFLVALCAVASCASATPTERGGAPTASQSVPSDLPASIAGTTEVRAFTCEGVQPQYKPHQLLISCGDGNARAANLRWTRWDQTEARAIGIWQQNDCRPDCAAGRFLNYPLRLLLSDPVTHGRQQVFGLIVAVFPRAAPPYPAYASHRTVVLNLRG